MQSVIEWKDAKKELPDDDVLVLVYMPKSAEKVWMGSFEGTEHDDDGYGQWIGVDGAPLTCVSHWAEMPERETDQCKA